MPQDFVSDGHALPSRVTCTNNVMREIHYMAQNITREEERGEGYVCGGCGCEICLQRGTSAQSTRHACCHTLSRLPSLTSVVRVVCMGRTMGQKMTTDVCLTPTRSKGVSHTDIGTTEHESGQPTNTAKVGAW